MGVGRRSSVKTCEGVTDDLVGSTVASDSDETGKELDGTKAKDEAGLVVVLAKSVLGTATDILLMTEDRIKLSEMPVVLGSDGSGSVLVG